MALLGALLLGCGLRLFLHVEPQRLSPQVWAYLGGGGNSLVVLHKTDAFVADLKQADSALRLKRMVEEGLDKRVRRVLLTHSHPDHWGGLVNYPDAGAVLAHPKTRERIAAALKRQRLPDVYGWVSVTSEVRLVLGEEEVWIRHFGPAHTDGDLVAFVPGLKLVMTGDLFSRGFEPAVDAESGGQLLGLRQALDRMLAYDFEQVEPGHGPMATRAEVVAVRDYLAAMEAALREAAGRGLSEDAAVEAGEQALRSFPWLEPLPLSPDRRGNLRAMYRELTASPQAGKSAAP